MLTESKLSSTFNQILNVQFLGDNVEIEAEKDNASLNRSINLSKKLKPKNPNKPREISAIPSETVDITLLVSPTDPTTGKLVVTIKATTLPTISEVSLLSANDEAILKPVDNGITWTSLESTAEQVFRLESNDLSFIVPITADGKYMITLTVD